MKMLNSHQTFVVHQPKKRFGGCQVFFRSVFFFKCLTATKHFPDPILKKMLSNRQGFSRSKMIENT
jgi:hypothetical protein